MPCLVGKTRIHSSVSASLISPLLVISFTNGIKIIHLDVYCIGSVLSVVKSEHAQNTPVLFMMHFHGYSQMQVTQTFCVLERFLKSRV